MENCENYSGSLRDGGSGKIDTRRVIVFIGIPNTLPRDELLCSVLKFCGLDRESIEAFTPFGGNLSGFMRFLHSYPNQFSRAVILFAHDEKLFERSALKRIPLPWEAFRIFPDGGFSRILEEGEFGVLDRDRWIRVEEMFK